MDLYQLIEYSMAEDIQTGDITTDLLISPSEMASATIIAKVDGVFFGTSIINQFLSMHPELTIKITCNDGDLIYNQTICAHIDGPYHLILKVERTLLNFLQRLSGIATTTASYVSALNDPSIQVLDTRKTTPLLRDLEKAAVVAGGGHNHRHGLYDMILIKENHLNHYLTTNQLSDFQALLHKQKTQSPSIQIELEISSFDELKIIDLSSIDIILFDNMSLSELQRCIEFCNVNAPHCLKEVSGNIRLDTISRYRGIDIDRISIGALTHSVTALDLSLLIS